MKVTLNGEVVEGREGETILELSQRNGINIPTLCYIKDLFPTGACRMCVVEVEGNKNLTTSCTATLLDGMNIKTHSAEVLSARKQILELLLADHPDDCLYCSKSGHCELQSLSKEMGVKNRNYKNKRKSIPIDNSGLSLVREPDKCVLCGRCVRVCEEVQNVGCIDFINRGSKTYVGPAFNEGINLSSCVNCGQCVLACPTGALVEQTHIEKVLFALGDKKKHVVIQHAPSVSVTIGEYFGVKEGVDIEGKLNAGLRRMGFSKVFDTSFAADLTIMEEASELVARIQNKGKLPMFTSCSPGWVKYVEHRYPEYLSNISTCKSPQQMMGAMIKSYYAKKVGIDPKDIISVSVMPCTAKKFEANREGMGQNKLLDVDAVLTTRELAKMFKLFNIDLATLTPENADDPLGEKTSAGKIFGATGGVMEAAVRTAAYMITGKNISDHPLKEIRTLDGIKEMSLSVGGLELNVAVVNGLGNVANLMNEIKSGKKDIHFVEVMTCPGGCINGGGQPYGVNKERVVERMKALHAIDRTAKVKRSHENQAIQKLYHDFLEKPLSHKSHQLLHTHYVAREGF